jgi:hypothetical protein
VVEGIIASGKVPVMEMDMHVSIIAPPMLAHLTSLVRASSNSRTMDMLLGSFS